MTAKALCMEPLLSDVRNCLHTSNRATDKGVFKYGHKSKYVTCSITYGMAGAGKYRLTVLQHCQKMTVKCRYRAAAVNAAEHVIAQHVAFGLVGGLGLRAIGRLGGDGYGQQRNQHAARKGYHRSVRCPGRSARPVHSSCMAA